MSTVLQTRMSKEGRVLIPAELRRLLDLKPDEPLHVYAVDGELRIVSRLQGIRQAQAIAAKYKRAGISVVDEFIGEKRDEAARE
jgi:AbrB family looped-hinge helix DNA binding protein